MALALLLLTAQVSSVTLSITLPSMRDQAFLVRGEAYDFKLEFTGKAATARVRLVLSASATPGPRDQVMFEKDATTFASVKTVYSGKLTIPKVLTNGPQFLRAEVGGVGNSESMPVTVTSPKVQVLSYNGPSTVGGAVELNLDRLPTGCKLAITRVEEAPVSPLWYFEHKNRTQRVDFISVTSTKNADGTTKVSGNLPIEMGAGRFRVQVVGDSPDAISDLYPFSFVYPPAAPPRYFLRFEIIQCFESTDEASADEIYMVHMVGQHVPNDAPRPTPIKVVLSATRTMEAGQNNREYIQLLDTLDFDPAKFVWTVVLIEQDGGDPKGFEKAVKNADWDLVLRGRFVPERTERILLDAVMGEFRRQSRTVTNNDEFLGAHVLSITAADLTRALTKEGRVMKSVDFKGHDSLYNLQFSFWVQPGD